MKIYINATVLSLILIALFGAIETMITLILSGTRHLLTVGFPFPFYSFVSNRFLPIGVFLDTVVYSSIIIFFSKVYSESPKESI